MNSGSSSSSQLPNVCITTGGIVEGDAGHHLYMVDLNDAESGHLAAPTAAVADASCALCVIESTIYIFEAEPVDAFLVPRDDGKFVYSYALSISDHVILKLKDMTQVCSMNDTKFCPRAISTPDGSSIVVCSSAIRPSYSNDTSRCDFELFDVATQGCRTLPQLSLRPSRGSQKTVPIISAILKGGSVLLVLLETRIYSLNLFIEGNWEPFTEFDNCIPMGTPFDLIGEEICLTSFRAYDVRTGSKTTEFDNCIPMYDRINSPSFNYLPRSKIRGSLHPLLEQASFTYPDLSKSDRTRGPPHPLLLDSNNPQDSKFCILHPQFEDDDGWGTPHYIIDIYTCDVEKFIQSRQRNQRGGGLNRRRPSVDLPATTKLKSLHFSLPKNDAVLSGNHSFTVSSISNPFNCFSQLLT